MQMPYLFSPAINPLSLVFAAGIGVVLGLAGEPRWMALSSLAPRRAAWLGALLAGMLETPMDIGSQARGERRAGRTR